MPTLNASDYTTYLKMRAASASPIRPAIQTRTNATLSQSVLNANLLTSQMAQLTTPSQVSLFTSKTETFTYTGTDQTFMVPPTVYSLEVALTGAGGETASSGSNQGEGGPGGFVSGTLKVSPGQQYTIVVGGSTTGYGGGAAGGGAGAGRGGGRTAIRLGSGDVVTAGGGGGGAFKTQGGFGGGLVGGSGSAIGGVDLAIGIVTDSVGNVFVANFTRHTILKITTAGVVSVFAGSDGNSGFADGNGSIARFTNPQGLAIDQNDNLYVGDSGNRVIRRVAPNRDVTTIAGTQGVSGDADGAVGVGRFGTAIAGLVYDGSANLYVADQSNNKIRQVVISTGVISTFAGPAAGTTTAGDTDGTGTAARFRDPFGITITGGNLYVAESSGNRVRKITSGAVVTTLAGSTTATSGATDADGTTARFADPRGIATDGTYLYVSELTNNKIRRITLASPYTVTSYTGTASTQMTAGFVNGTSLSEVRFENPYGMWYSGGALYVTDGDSNGLIRKVTASGATDYVKDATGGTQTVEGTSGSGAGAASGTTGGTGKSGDQAGGGGGGYFGGGGGTTNAAGAGGSSYVANLMGNVVNLQGGGALANTNGSLVVTYTYAYKETSSPSPGRVNHPQALSTLSFAGTSGALSSSRVQQPGGLPTGFKGSQGSYHRIPQNAGGIQGNTISSGPKRF